MANGEVVPLAPSRPREQQGTQIQPGRIQRIVEGLQYMISGVKPEGWMNPGQPLIPQHQEVAGRQFDFPYGVNLYFQPRREQTESGITFEQLRGLAESYDLLRLVIETRKDQISSYSWDIVPSDVDTDPATVKDDITLVTDFLMRPNRESNWDEWLRMSLEEIFVTDAWCVYPRKTKGGGLYSLDLVDGATIKRLVDEEGRQPISPNPAFQQIIKGVPVADLTTDMLVYAMRNPRVWKLYGYPPVEQIIITVNIAMRRQLHQLSYYTEGNVPEALAGVPPTWSMDQIKSFQLWWDSLMEGNLGQRRHMKFLPSLDKIVFPKEALLKDEYDEWLARLVCFCFSIQPTPFIKQMNRATAQQAAKTAKEEGLFPTLTWLERRMTFIIQKYLSMPHLRFKWDMSESLDPLVQAQIDQIYITTKVTTPDEVRDNSLDLDPLTKEQREAAWPTPTEFGPDGVPVTKDPEGNVTSKHSPKSSGNPDNDKSNSKDSTEKALLIQPVTYVQPATVKLGDTFVRVHAPEVRTPDVNLNLAEQVEKQIAGGVKTTTVKKVRARRDPQTGDLVGEITETATHRKEEKQ